MRESFVELDFDNIGVIDLDELQMVVKYAGDQLRVKRGPSFKNVAKMFAQMDEDGNGEEDDHEFMVEMALEQDVNMLRAKFSEFAMERDRRRGIVRT